MSSEATKAPAQAVTPAGLNHLVINVRDLDESHRFYTEILGFEQVGEFRDPARRRDRSRMRFYSGVRDGLRNHHDLALVEKPGLPEPPEDPLAEPLAVNHIAITLPDREAWLAQLAFLQSRGVKFDRRVEHGMTHSCYIRDPNGYGVELLYELPREVWGGDIDGALNYYRNLPTEGPEALEDRTDGLPVFAAAASD